MINLKIKSNGKMLVVKRDGTSQSIDFEKIHWRIKSMCAKSDILEFQKKKRPNDYSIFHKLTPIENADVDTITKKTIEGLYNNIPTTEIDKLSAEVAQEMCTIHPDNSILATRILVSNLQKNNKEIMFKRFPEISSDHISNNLFKYVMTALYFNMDKHGEHSPLVSPYIVAIASKYNDKINDLLDYSRDFTNHDYLGIKTLEKGYLFRVHSMNNFTEKNIIVESPGISDMRITLGLICAPIPCPELYSDALKFIITHPEVIKSKYRSQNDFTSYKDKRIDSKLFKKLYWEYQLKKETEKINISEDQWKRIQETYNGMSLGKFTPATPTRFSSGALRPQGSSCFLIAMKDDSLKGIYETLHEQSQISKHAGGVGLWVHNIRSTGSYIAGTNGLSTGLTPMLQLYDASSGYVNQGGKRDGTVAVYLEPWHADILNFLKLKRKKGADTDRARRLFYALWIPDEFFRCWKDKKDWYLFDPSICPKLYDSYDEEFSSKYLSDEYVSANKKNFLFTYRYRKYIRQGKYEKKISTVTLMEEVVETVKDSGTPYMLSKDACNRKSNQKNLGVIKSSNLCVSGETYILTDKGQKVIKDVVGQNVNVWNGKEFSSTIVRKTGVDKKLLFVKLSNGVEIKCTPEHKFYIVGGSRNQKKIIMQGDQLKINDRLIKYNLPTLLLEKETDVKYPYTQGFFSGDGTTYYNYSKTKKYPKAYLYGEKKKLLEYMNYESYSNNVSCDRYDLVLPKDLKEKFYVPFNENLETTLRWFEGYCDADGTIARNGANESLQIGSIEKDFLLKIKLILQVIGIDSKVTKNQDARKSLLPDHKGGLKEYDCKEIFRLLISSNGLYQLSKLGFKPKRLEFDEIKPQRNASHFIKVVGIEKLDEREDTYCFTEEKRHMGMFNGILTGQCTEIIQYSDEKETSVCNLASICLNKFIRTFKEGDNPNFKYNVSLNQEDKFLTFDWDEFANTVRIIQNNIDRLIDLNFYPTENSRRSNMKNRPMSIGVQSEADMFAMLHLPWNSKEAHKLRFYIFERMYYECLKASLELAKLNGRYEGFDDSPASSGKLQFDLWKDEGNNISFSLSLQWDELKQEIVKHGIRNSLFIGLMPTASTSNIMGNSPAIEPFNSLVYIRKAGAGDITIINKNLVKDLMSIGLWDKTMSSKILENHGSIKDIVEIPKKLRDSYLTVYDLEPKDIVDAAFVRGWFVDQSQSMNLFLKNVTMLELSKAWTRGWMRGLKTLSYYCRTRSATTSQKIQIRETEKKMEDKVCYRDDPDCLSCGS